MDLQINRWWIKLGQGGINTTAQMR